MRPKEADRSGLGPPHHLSGTEGSNPARSSGESANHLSGDRHTMPAPAAASCSSFRSSQRSTSAGANGRDGGFAPIGDRFADHARLGIMLPENRCALLSADRLLERGVEFSLLTDTFEDSGATFVQLAQIRELHTSAR